MIYESRFKVIPKDVDFLENPAINDHCIISSHLYKRNIQGVFLTISQCLERPTYAPLATTGVFCFDLEV